MMGAAQLTTLLFKYNRVAALVFAVLVALLALGVPRLQVSSDSAHFFGENNAEFADVQTIDDTFTQSKNILLMVTPPIGTAFVPETLRILQKMTDDAWQMPYALRVDSAVNTMHSYAEGDEVLVEPMLDEFEEVTEASAARFRELALASDTLRNTLLSEAGDTYGFSIRLVLPDDSDEARKEVEAYTHDLRRNWRAAYPGWQVHTAGSVLGNNLLARVAVEDILYLVPLALCAVIILLILALGSVKAVGAIVVVLISAMLTTFGFAGWIGVELTAGTAIGPLAVMVLVSTSCVHIMLGTIRAHELGSQSVPFRYAIAQNLAPVTISHLTTAFGFLCLNFAPSPPLAAMGNIVAFGLLTGHLGVFIVLPFLLERHAPNKPGLLMLRGTTMRRLAQMVQLHSKLWLILFPLGVLAACAGIARIGYDDNIIRYFDHRYELRQDAEAIQSGLTGLDRLQFHFQAPADTSVFEPAFLQAVDRFAIWLEKHESVVAVTSVTGIIKDINQSMSGDDPDAFAIAPTQPGNAQLLMLYELSLPAGMDLGGVMDVDRTQTLLTATVRAPHSSVVRALADETEMWLRENEPQIATRAAGLGLAFARITQRNNAQMLYGFLMVLCLVSLTMVLTLRSLRYGVMSLVPNLLPALLAFGFWGWAIGDVNLGSTVVTTMTFGIVVDDTVHFLMHYLRGRRAGRDVDTALQETFAVVGSSIILTSVALMIGFGIMTISGFSINQHIGLLTAVVIVFALLSDLLFLPAMLKTFQGQPQKTGRSPKETSK